jgi:hypothetical protein
VINVRVTVLKRCCCAVKAGPSLKIAQALRKSEASITRLIGVYA